MPDQLPLTIKDAAGAIRAGDISSTSLTSQLLDKITSLNETLGAFVTICADTAMAAAEVADAELSSGLDRGVLHGIPLAIKDIISTKDAPTTANSRVLDPDWGKGVDAPVVARLRTAGAVIMGKATTSEFANGQPDPDKGFLIPHNPWNTEHTPAGSSSGTGIAVAAGLALGGLGTDTGGSIRGPAAVNGHTGLKPTFGRVPKNGVVPLGYTLDHVGPMARSAYDCAALLEVIAGYDAGDPYVTKLPVPEYREQLTGDVAGLRVGVPMPYFFDAPDLDAEVRDAVLATVALLKANGATVVETEIPYAHEAKEATMISSGGEAFAYHRNNLVNKWSDYGRYTRLNLVRGALMTAGDYAQVQRFRGFFAREVAKVLSGLDVLITPAMVTPAERIADMNPERRLTQSSFTGQWNFTGLPAAVAPCGFSSSGLPLSFQVIGKPFAEGQVLSVVDAYQRLTDWHLQVPPLAALVPA
jgi:aspartyl-tRNA(Asn)/glutamyl-tRNA(Gln) amidotransferase subunit A